MATDETVPLTVTPEAAEYIDRHGVREAFEKMLAHVRGAVPGLRAIDVELPPPYDLGSELIVIRAEVSHPDAIGPAQDDHDRWVLGTFPPEARMHFTMIAVPGGPDAR
jgi:hypothetical protein